MAGDPCPPFRYVKQFSGRDPSDPGPRAEPGKLNPKDEYLRDGFAIDAGEEGFTIPGFTATF